MTVPGTTENSSVSDSSTSVASSTGSGSSGGSTESTATTTTSLPSEGSALASLEKIAAADSSSATPELTSDGRPVDPSAPATGGVVKPGPAVGEAPESRIQAATKNALAKGREDANAEFRQQYSYLVGLNRDDGERAIRNYSRMMSDPRAFAYALLQEIGDDGTGQSGEAAEEELIDPEPDLVSQDGTRRAYSNEALSVIRENDRQRMLRELDGRLKPVLETTERAQQAEQMAALREQTTTYAREAITAARQLPHFKENEQKIGRVLASIDPNLRARVGSVAALYMAYNKVLADDVLPNLSKTTEAATIADLTRAATAGAATVGTHAATPGRPALRDGDLTGLARHMERLHSGA